MTVGIVGCGVYVPTQRIKREEYQKAWGYFAPRWLEEKTVADFDEDPITMAVEAAANALRSTSYAASLIDALYFASTSPPYAEKQNAVTVATALGCRNDTAALDISSSTRCGLSAVLSGLDYVESSRGKTCLVVASDAPFGDPSESFDHQLGAGAAALILGRGVTNGAVEGSYSVSIETLGERFRREGHRFTATMELGRYQDVASETAILSCLTGLMKKLGRSPRDYDFLAITGVDPNRGVELGKKLGFEETKMTPSLVLGKIGDAGAASSLLVISKLLEMASFKQRALLCSYGPGSGADALCVVVDGEMKATAGLSLDDYLARKRYVDYPTYLRVRRTFGS